MNFLFSDLFADGNDFGFETIENGRNRFYQKRLAKEINEKFRRIVSTLSKILQIHLNFEQKLSIETSSISFSLQTIRIENLRYKSKANLTSRRSLSIRVRFSC